MNFMWSVFFGAGIATVVYSKMGRRLGYGNQQNVWTLVGVVFVLSTIIFLVMFSTFIK